MVLAQAMIRMMVVMIEPFLEPAECDESNDEEHPPMLIESEPEWEADEDD